MHDEISKQKQMGRKALVDADLFVRSGRRKLYFPNSIVIVSCLVSYSERFPLAVQNIFQKQEILRALREFLQ